MPNKNLSTESTGFEGTRPEAMLRDLFACGTLVINAQGNIASLSDAAAAILELSAQDRPEKISSLPAPLSSLIQETLGAGRAQKDCRIVLPAGRSGRNTHLTVTVLPIALGKEQGILVTIRSFSAYLRLELELRRLHRLASLGTLSASMAHEIKNALVAVRTFVDLFLERNPDAELAGIVRREMTRVESIVSHMLKFGAPSQPAFAPVHLNDILDHALRLAKHRAGSKIIAFTSDFQAAADVLIGDDRQLEQAFVNLLLNAVEAMGAEGTVAVRTTQHTEGDSSALREGSEAGFVRITITDTGAGISGEDLSRIFDPFFTTKPNGTGLGLAVTRRIIEEHNGRILAQSEPGTGTTFTILLPTQAP